jgi:CubicO group peptidase (beta-lactamase class C family)
MKATLFVLVFLASGTACAARPPLQLHPPTVDERTIDSARALLRSLIDTQRIPGFAITVTYGRQVVWREGLGFADLDAHLPASSATQFRIGSVSKLLTATALMRLSQTGRIDLDVPMVDYLNVPPDLRAITLRQLAGHLGGIRHYRGNEFISNVHYDRLQDALPIFTSDSLLSTPGARYAYSSYGYNLIGAALEAKLRLPFPDLIRRYVLEPLGMTSTVPDAGGTGVPARARGYTVGATGVTPAPPDDLSGRWPSGGYLSTTDDLARLGQSVLASGLLSDRSLTTMLTPQRLTSGAPTSVGIGWRISTDSAGRSYVHHGGSSNGGSAFLLVYPKQQLVVAMASNAFTRWGEREALAIAQLFLLTQ